MVDLLNSINKNNLPESKNKNEIRSPPLVDRMILRITKFGHLCGFSDQDVSNVLDQVFKLLEPLPAMIEVKTPMVLFGDIHGQLNDLLRYFTLIGTPESMNMMFLGDYVDRCKKSFEVVMLLLLYKLKYPEKVHLLRGNHECAKMNRLYGFYEEVKRKRSTALWKRFQEVFNEMPLCANIQRKILCMHGGISPGILGWESLAALKKPKTPKMCDEGIAVDLMWSDPTNDSCVGFQFNTTRATSYIFGVDTLQKFNELLGISLVVRAHEVIKDGHSFLFDNRLLTIFSAPNYCGSDGNCGSIMFVSAKFEVSFLTLKPKLNMMQLSEERKKLIDRMSVDVEVKSPDPYHRTVTRTVVGADFVGSSESCPETSPKKGKTSSPKTDKTSKDSTKSGKDNAATGSPTGEEKKNPSDDKVYFNQRKAQNEAIAVITTQEVPAEAAAKEPVKTVEVHKENPDPAGKETKKIDAIKPKSPEAKETKLESPKKTETPSAAKKIETGKLAKSPEKKEDKGTMAKLDSPKKNETVTATANAAKKIQSPKKSEDEVKTTKTKSDKK